MTEKAVDANIETGTPPVPRSEAIRRLTWDAPEHIIRMARGRAPKPPSQKMDGSDNWPLTWADDDGLYAAYGDGFGFDPILPMKLGMGFARIEGTPPDIQGINVRSEGENKDMGRTGKKGSGMLMVDGILYMWLFHANGEGGRSQLAWSADRARTWTFSDWKFENFSLCAFINYGRNYSGARDGYVYTVTPESLRADTPSDRMILLRVSKDRIPDRAAYEFYVGMDRGEPVWTSEIDKKGAVFEHRDACLRSGITYNSALQRYLWWQHIPNEPGHRDRGDTRFSGGFGIYDAPEPWGPWTTVYYTEQWDVGPGERAEFPAKWISQDGKTLYLAYSGDDSFCVRKAVLEL